MDSFKMPYIDLILKLISRGRMDVKRAFGWHCHYGYWDDPQMATGSIDDFFIATEKMTEKMVMASNINDGQKVLDVGCGFGGTLAYINRNFLNMSLCGVNIDERQLEIARQNVVNIGNNTVNFTVGAASSLPCPDSCVDRILAVECIFHFPSRETFFREAYRVLKPGGVLCISDFVMRDGYKIKPWSKDWLISLIIKCFWGNTSNVDSQYYSSIIERAGFKSISERDVSAHVIPTFKVFFSLLKVHPLGYFSNWMIKHSLVGKFDRYVIYSFKKTGC